MSTGLHGLLWDESKREALIEGIRKDLEWSLERYGDGPSVQEYRDRMMFFEELLDGHGKEHSDKVHWTSVAARALAEKQERAETVDLLAKQIDELLADAEKEEAEHDAEVDRMQREHVAERERLHWLLDGLRSGVASAVGVPEHGLDEDLVNLVARLRDTCDRHDAERRLFISLFTYAKVDQYRDEGVGCSYEQAVASAEATVSHLLRVFHESQADYEARFQKPAAPPNPHDF